MISLGAVLLSLSIMKVVAGTVVNKEVTRVVDASNSVVRVTTNIKAVNVEGEYQLIFPNELASHLAHISVSSKGNALLVSAPVM